MTDSWIVGTTRAVSQVSHAPESSSVIPALPIRTGDRLVTDIPDAKVLVAQIFI
jgi:hypothetical protein